MMTDATAWAVVLFVVAGIWLVLSIWAGRS